MIGFLIINYNDLKTTITLLENIKSYSCLKRILVVDNGSTDNSYQQLLSYQSDKITILKNKENGGYGAGINYGVRYLEKEGITHTFISNSDIIISSEQDLIKIIDNKDKGAIIAPVIKEHEGYNRGWKIPTPKQTVLLSLPIIYRHFINCNKYKEEYYENELVSVDAVSGCFFLISLEALKKADYFDENIFLYFEENIIARRMKDEKIYLMTKIEVFHNHAVTIDKNLNRIKKYKTLSQSRRYFEKEYNHANPLILFILWFIEKITIACLTVKSMIKL